MRNQKVVRDEKDYKLIQKIFNQKKKQFGTRFLKIKLENTRGITMNLKRIFRIMRTYNLKTQIRRVNPYKQLAKAKQEHKTCPNLLQLQFNQEEPEKSMLKGITYLFYGKERKPNYLISKIVRHDKF